MRSDAGHDAGPDAALDAGLPSDDGGVPAPDAEVDAGLPSDDGGVPAPDAEVDAGSAPDASPDAGVDAGGLPTDPTYGTCDAPVRAYASGRGPVDLDVAVDGLGNAILVFRDIISSGGFSTYAIRVVRYTPGVGWGAATDFINPISQPGLPRVAVNAAGDAFVYVVENTSRQAFWVSRWDRASAAWEMPVNLLSNTASYVSYPSLQLDAAGNAWAVFEQSPPGLGIGGVWATRYVLGTGWSTPVRVDAAATANVDSTSPALALNGGGHGVVAWIESSTTPSSAKAAFIAVDGTLSTPVVVDNHAGNAGSPAVAINDAGVGLVAYTQLTVGAAATWDVGVASFASEVVQSAGPVILAADGSTASSVHAAIDAVGNEVVAYRKASSPFAARAMIAFDQGAGWSVPVPFDTRGNANTDFVGLALAANGRGIASCWDGAVAGAGLYSSGVLGTPRTITSGSAPAAAIAPNGAALFVYTPQSTGPVGLDAIWCR